MQHLSAQFPSLAAPPLPHPQPLHSLSSSSERVTQIVAAIIAAPLGQPQEHGNIQMQTRYGEGELPMGLHAGWARLH